MSKDTNSRGATQPELAEPVLSSLEVFSDVIHNQLDIERKIMFGEFMTLIETLGLPEKQYNAVKSLIGQQVSGDVRTILQMFDAQVERLLGYKREVQDVLEVLS